LSSIEYTFKTASLQPNPLASQYVTPTIAVALISLEFISGPIEAKNELSSLQLWPEKGIIGFESLRVRDSHIVSKSNLVCHLHYPEYEHRL
jgi:hypothetical protein